MSDQPKTTAIAKTEPKPVTITQAADIFPVPAPPQQPVGLPPGSTQGLSELQLTEKQIEILRAELDPETEVEIRQDGVCYIPAGVVRQRLDKAFGPGKWALRQERDPFFDEATEECCYDGSLWVNGCYVSRAIGGCRWQPNNRQMTRSDALEGAKSDCLRRCCKDIGIGASLWNPAFIRGFFAEYAEPYQGKDFRGNPKVCWRKHGQLLRGEELAKADGLAGEFPLGFGPDSPLPDGTHAGEPISSVDDATLTFIMQKASTQEWKLVAKAEMVRRTREAQKDAEKAERVASAEDVVEDLIKQKEGKK